MKSKDFDDYIETYTGVKFNFLNPQTDQIRIEDIAHSLSMQCRYTGHCNKFYSIAEHSLLVADLCPDNELYALLHDASEAYLTDVASPIKPFLQNYKLMESKVCNAIMGKYGLPQGRMPDDVYAADLDALRMEAKQLMHSEGKDWVVNKGITHVNDIEIQSLSPTEAKTRFLTRFYKVYKEL